MPTRMRSPTRSGGVSQPVNARRASKSAGMPTLGFVDRSCTTIAIVEPCRRVSPIPRSTRTRRRQPPAAGHPAGSFRPSLAQVRHAGSDRRHRWPRGGRRHCRYHVPAWRRSPAPERATTIGGCRHSGSWHSVPAVHTAACRPHVSSRTSFGSQGFDGIDQRRLPCRQVAGAEPGCEQRRRDEQQRLPVGHSDSESAEHRIVGSGSVWFGRRRKDRRTGNRCRPLSGQLNRVLSVMEREPFLPDEILPELVIR